MSTEIVYVVSPDFGHYLFASLASVMASASTFDRVRIYCVGRRPADWVFNDERIQVDEVEAIDKDYFLANKAYLSRTPADRVVFLDADTIVLRPLDHIWTGKMADVIGRKAARYKSPAWDAEGWRARVSAVGGGDSPYLNSGVVVFQNGSHRKLVDRWPTLTEAEKAVGAAPFGARMAEQVAMSLSIAAERLSVETVEAWAHAYGWENETPERTIVFHTGTGEFFRQLTRLRDSNLFRLRSCPASLAGPTGRLLIWRLIRARAGRALNPLLK
ncbi:MAG TPA: hypothetical protein VHG28_13010 [Longimicrobiaceae bacterium]|nr:hypothetical protein [Longimicrobiaceae bacterium]